MKRQRSIKRRKAKKLSLLCLDSGNLGSIIAKALSDSGYSPQISRVRTRTTFTRSLKTSRPDVVIVSSASAPRDLDGCLSDLKDLGFPVPFILVGDTFDEESKRVHETKGVSEFITKARISEIGDAVTRLIRTTSRRVRRTVSPKPPIVEHGISSDILNVSNEAIWDWNISDGVVNISPQWITSLGYDPPSGARGPEFWKSLIHPDDVSLVTGNLLAHLEGKTEYFECECRVRRNDGTWRWHLGRGRVVERSASGDPSRMVGTAMDETDRRVAEDTLRDSLERFRIALKHSPVTVSNQDRDLRYTWVYNPAFGFSQESMIGKTDAELLGEESAAEITAIKRQVLEAGVGNRSEVTIVYGGTTWWYDLTVELMRNVKGEIVGITCSGEDITRIKEADRVRRLLDLRCRTLVDLANDAIFLIDAKSGMIVDANRKAQELVQRPLDELLTMHHSYLHPEGDRTEYIHLFLETIQQHGGITGEVEVMRRDGVCVPVEISSSLLEIDGKELVQGIFRDVSERRHTEEALRLSQQQLHYVVSSSPIILFSIDRKGIFTLSEGNGLHALGLKPNQVLGQSAFELYKHVPQILLNLRRALAGESFTSVVDVSGLIFETWYSPVRNKEDEISGAIGVSTDITERRKIEDALRRRDAVLESTAFAAEQFLTSPDWKRSIDVVLARLGMATKVSRVYLFENLRKEPGYHLSSQRFEWVEEGIVPQIDNLDLKQFHWEHHGFAAWIRQMEKGDVVGGHAAAFSEQIREFLEEESIKSILIVPIFAGSSWWGIMGFDECKAERVWSPSEVDALRVAANTLGAAINRQESEETLRLVQSAVEHANDPVIITSANLDMPGPTIVYVNPAFTRMTGYLASEVIGQSPRILQGSKTDLAEMSRMKEELLHGRMFFGETVNYRKDGSEYILEWHVGPIRNAAGEITHYVSIQRDITERKKVEDSLRLSDNILQRIGNLVLVADETGCITYVSPSSRALIGYGPAELIGDGWWEMTRSDPEPRKRERDWIANIARGARPLDENLYEREILHKDGSSRWFLWRDSKGPGNQIIGVGYDVTERKKADNELYESRQMLQFVLDNIPQRVFWKDREFRYLGCNDSFAHDAGLQSPAEILGKNDFELAWRDSANLYRVDDAAVMDNNSPKLNFEEPQVRADGSRLWLTTSKVPLHDRQGNVIGILGTYEDITPRKRAEESLHKLLSAVEQTDEVILMTDPEGIITYVNPAFEKVYGYPKEGVIGNTPQILGAGGGNGSPEDRFSNDVRRMKSVQGEYIHRSKEGKQVIVESSINPVFAPDGTIVGCIVVQNNITERKLIEQERKNLETQLFQVQKMESIGILAGGIAHDFNNLLGIILGYATILSQSTNDPLRIGDSVDAITKAVQRGSTLVRQILTFARRGPIELRPVNLAEPAKEISQIIEETFPKTIALISNIGDDLPYIKADHIQIHQALLNLCLNARDAMPDGGRLTISASVVNGSDLREQFPDATDDRYVGIKVHDTGGGINETIRNRIFEPFFTTKEKGKGTGLGLAVVYGIVKSHRGLVHVESEIKKGSTFSLYFPAVSAPGQEEEQQADLQTEPRGGEETILLVEDEELLVDLMRRVLEREGYNVLVARDGEEAVERYKRMHGTIDLTITDLGLPKIGGWDVLKRMREINPRVKTLLTSGYIDPEMKEEIEKSGVCGFLQKPVFPMFLLAKVRETLDMP